MKRFLLLIAVLISIAAPISCVSATILAPGPFVVLPATTLDPDALNWQTNIVAVGSSVSASTLLAASNFAIAAKAHNYWSKLIIVCPIAGTNEVSARRYLKYPGTITNALSVGTVMTYNETGASGGIVGNGTSSYWNTQYNPSSAGASVSSFSLWGYANTTSAAGTSRFILHNSAVDFTNATTLGWVLTGTTETGNVAAQTVPATPQYATGTTTARTGFLGVNVNGSRAMQYYVNGSSVGGTTNATGAFSNFNLHLLAQSAGGVASGFSTRRISFFVISTGLDSTDISNLYTDVLAFQTALSRN